MNEELIKKLNLVETDIEIGHSALYGIKVYRYKENILLANCDITGRPKTYVMIRQRRYNHIQYRYVSPEILLDLPIDDIDKLLIEIPDDRRPTITLRRYYNYA